MGEKKNNNVLIAIIIAVAAVAIAAIIAVVVLLGGNKDTAKDNDGKKTEQAEKAQKEDVDVFVVLAEDDEGNVTEIECEVPAGIMYEDYEEDDLEGWVESNGAVECNLFYALYDGDGYDIENLILVDNYGNGFYDNNGELIAEYLEWEEDPYVGDYEEITTATLTLRSGYKCVMTEYSETSDGVSWYVTDRYFRFEDEYGHGLDEDEILEELEGTAEGFLVERFIYQGWPVIK